MVHGTALGSHVWAERALLLYSIAEDDYTLGRVIGGFGRGVH